MEDDEKDVRRYWMTLSKKKRTLEIERRNIGSQTVESALEEAMGLS